MRILVLGAGAIGGYYGARLLQAGADVTFAVRPPRRAALARDGLVLHSALGDFKRRVDTVDAHAINGPYDAVLLACKGYDLMEAMDDIAPAVGPDSVILPFLNGLGVYTLLDRRFGRERVLGGVAYIATQMEPDGAIRHLGTGDTVLVGARGNDAKALDAARALHALLGASEGTRVLAPDIVQSLWDKWTMLAAGAALTCLLRGSIAQIHAATGGAALVERAIDEAEQVAAADGYPIRGEGAARIRTLLLDPASPWMASMARDIARGAPRIEHEQIVGDLVRLAQGHGIATPLFDAAYAHLQIYAAQAAKQ
jgi:2-dehydropantoate 2-reductase